MFLYNKEVVFQDMEELVSREYVPYEMLRDKTVLITGATGMLAYYFTMALMHLNLTKDYNIKVVALVRNAKKAEAKFAGFLEDSRFEILAQDVCAPIKYDGAVDYISTPLVLAVHTLSSTTPQVLSLLTPQAQ